MMNTQRSTADFARWCENLIDEINTTKPINITLNLALLNLQDAFCSWFTCVPKLGKNHLFAIYQQTYTALRNLALSITL